MMIPYTIKIAWILLNLICLAFAAYYDWKERIILDRIWVAQLLGGIIFLIYYFSTDPTLFSRIMIFINVLFGIFFLLVLLFTRILGIGDMKGFFVISISFPIYLTLVDNPIFLFPDNFPAFFAILLNFFMLLTLFSLINFSRNLILSFRENMFEGTEGSFLQKFSLMIEGMRISKDKLENWKHYNPGEVYSDGKWQLFTPNYDSLMDDEEFEKLEAKEKEELKASLKISEKSHIWIRPQVPGMLILFLAFALQIVVGTPLGILFTSLTT